MKKWDAFMQHAEEQGSDLDVDLAWEEFQESRAKRTFLLRFNPKKIAVLGTTILFLFLIGNQPIQITQVVQTNNTDKQKIAHSSKTIAKNDPLKAPLQTVGAKKIITNKVITSSTSLAGPTFDEKSTPNSQEVAQRISERSTNITKKTIITDDSLNKNTERVTSIAINNPTYTYAIDSKPSILSSQQKQNIQIPIERKLFPSVSKKRAILKPIPLATTDEVVIKIPPKRLVHKQPSKGGIGIKSVYSLPFRSITGSEETSSTRRQQAETFLESTDLQIQVQKFVTSKLYVVSGITIGQYRSKFLDEFQIINTNVAFDNQVTEVVFKNGVPTESMGTVYGSRTELHTRTKYQHYIDISIPLQLGIQLPLSRTWSIRAASGFNYSLFHINKGEVLASATSIGEYADFTALKYRKTGLLQVSSNINLVKNLSKSWDMTLGVEMKRDLNSRVLDNAATSDKFHAYGISLGLMKRF